MVLSIQSYVLPSIQELGKIIQKDFFPDLEKLKAQNAYLDAVERNDLIKLREIYAKYSGSRPSERVGCKSHRKNIFNITFFSKLNLLILINLQKKTAESPATFETPQRDGATPWNSTPGSVLFRERNADAQSTISASSSKKAPSDGHTLDSFLQTHTSEDNCSFQELIESADKKLRQKFSVLFEAEEQTALAIAQSLSLPNIEDQYKEICGPKKVWNIAKHTLRQLNVIMILFSD